MIKHRNKEEGLIGTLILIIIALALLKYFLDWSVFEAAATPKGHETLNYVKELVDTMWSFLSVPFGVLWHQILLPLLSWSWEFFQKYIIFGRDSTPLNQ